MALFKPIIDTTGYGPGNGLELFVSTDIYRYDVDNRPLENLASNDQAIKDSVDALVDEIEDAYTGKYWPDGTDFSWTALDPRLDNMDFFLQEFFEIRNVQYSSFVQFANFLRERYTSGFMNGPFPDKFVRSNYAMENNEDMPSPVGGFYIPERARTVRDPDVPDEDTGRLLAMETRIEQDGIGGAANRKPLYVLVNGWVVPLLNAHGGTADEAETIDGHRAAGNWGPVTIDFPQAPATGHRFDFAFLEVWAKEVVVGTDWFYPYGSRDFSQWGQENLFECAASGASYSGQIDDRRDGVREDQTGWAFVIKVRDTASAPGDRVDWSVDGYDASANAAGGIVDNGSGYGIGG
ncbi:MAG: hypothetical protein MJA29_01535, partial [Candidatus Omnitrophica bacterium]|nr:hypothetical protein [Candidatus Omnitrophota bacterium]